MGNATNKIALVTGANKGRRGALVKRVSEAGNNSAGQETR